MPNIDKLETIFQAVKTTLADFNQSTKNYKKSVAIRKALQLLKQESQVLREEVKTEFKKPAA
jgi:hypothetical protein